MGGTAVTLAWEAPANAVSFDIYWAPADDSKKPDGAVLVNKVPVRGRAFQDDGATTWGGKAGNTKLLPQESLIYSAIPTLPGNLNEFHNAKLDCFRGNIQDEKCSPKLGTAPTTRFYVTH
jgi:hypothetical protein